MVKAEMSLSKIRKEINKLSADKRLKLIEDLNRRTWKDQFKRLLSKIDERVAKNPISEEEVNRLVEQARQEYYEKRGR